MTVRSRLRRLGVDGTTRFECTHCGGTGTIADSDTPCLGARLQWTMNRVYAEIAGVPPPDDPEPDCSDDPLYPCPVCRGAGTASNAAATRWDRAAEDADRLVCPRRWAGWCSPSAANGSSRTANQRRRSTP